MADQFEIYKRPKDDVADDKVKSESKEADNEQKEAVDAVTSGTAVPIYGSIHTFQTGINYAIYSGTSQKFLSSQTWYNNVKIESSPLDDLASNFSLQWTIVKVDGKGFALRSATTVNGGQYQYLYAKDKASTLLVSQTIESYWTFTQSLDGLFPIGPKVSLTAGSASGYYVSGGFAGDGVAGLTKGNATGDTLLSWTFIPILNWNA